MRITVYTDGLPLMDTNLDNLKIINPKITQEVNKVGKFDFTIYPDHPHFSLVQKMKSIITVYEEGQTEPLFRGRVYDEKQGFYNEKQVSCEGELAFLLDSVQRPWEFSGTPAELFTFFINRHNAQVDEARQFAVGNITVVDANDYIARSNSDYSSTWKEIEDKLIKTLGGYLWVRHEGGINYIDYLADFNVLSNQSIEFGKNLLDLSKNIKVDGFATALIPLGAKLKDTEGNDTSERLTIVDVNNGVDYVYNEEAVAEYGYIFTTHTWDDVTEATNLIKKGQAYIDDTAQFVASIEVSAADLNGATIDGEPVDVNSFRIGRYVKLTTKPHSLVDANFMISKLTRQLLKPEATKLTLGTTYKSLTEKQAQLPQKGETGAAGKNGKDGVNGNDGRGILSTVITYQAGTSGTAAPTGTWSTNIPTVAENNYLWTRTVITYTDNATSTSYSVSKMGAKGEQGERGLQGLQGEQGLQGIQGESGADGKTTYFHIKYSANANGNPMTETPSTYIGTYVDYTEADSTDYTKYTWARFQGSQGEKGDQGIAGTNGTNGQTSYLHIAYATSADGSQGFSVSDSTNKTYIGQYTDFTSADSTEYAKYKWTKIKGETGADGKDAAIQSETAPTDTSYMWLDISVEPPILKRWNGEVWVIVNDQSSAITLLEQRFSADIQSTEQKISETLSAGYYTKDDTDALVSAVSAEWEHTAEGFAMNFSTIEKELTDVTNSADARFQEINSYIRYEDGSIILGRSDSPLILKIENDRIAFTQNNTEVAYFKDNRLFVTDGEFTNSLQLGKFAFIPRSNGNLSFKKIIDY